MVSSLEVREETPRALDQRGDALEVRLHFAAALALVRAVGALRPPERVLLAAARALAAMLVVVATRRVQLPHEARRGVEREARVQQRASVRVTRTEAAHDETSAV